MPVLFDDLTDVYEAMVAWPKRLAHETPFFRGLFEEVDARRVMDVACGTGRHAAIFHQWGLEVDAADVSGAMIARAKAAFGEPDGLRWHVRGFEQPTGIDGKVDVALCLGNSLPLAPNRETVAQAIRRMVDAVRPGGLVVLHLLNLWRLADGPCLWQKSFRAEVAGQNVHVIKGVQRVGDRGLVHLLILDPANQRILQSESIPLLMLTPSDLGAMMAAGDAELSRTQGGYADEPYLPASSVDLIVVGRKEVARDACSG